MNAFQPDTLIRNPHACQVETSVEVAADAAKVWELVGDFGGFNRFIPALERIEMTGEGVRSCARSSLSMGRTWWWSSSTVVTTRPCT